MNVFVAGGSGFVGRSLCRVLVDRGHGVTAASRTPDPSELPADVEAVSVDVTDPDLDDAVAGHDAVVNLVALPSHVQARGRSHESVHADGTRHLVAASERTGVDRFVQLSGLGVDSDVETAYFKAKRRAERIVRESSLEWVIFRPSVIFGDGCAFVPFLERLAPPLVIPLPGGGQTPLQPIWVEDLTPLIADGLTEDRHVGNAYEIGGPEWLTLAEIVTRVRDGVVVPIPMALTAVLAALVDPLPWIPVGRDQYRALTLENTTTDDALAAFDVDPDSLRPFSADVPSEGKISAASSEPVRRERRTDGERYTSAEPQRGDEPHTDGKRPDRESGVHP
ncbi:complex I NDUFA9 subunit family protein [Natrialba sp. INN-245]|uniref:complex I NDUFA9 subunit family protein n=1 Tax=Natrialba sp. INN-245 TaxID=2690967 RepID=UPI001310A572|nr:complex I NDUFA9 subunit family protein [Natrialba sp. INN-245]MWV41740.1 NAD(P)H-binding protein [Natrialba sp. INN-245]